jgi:hypothetical protein
MGNKSFISFPGLILVVLLAGCVTAAPTQKPSAPISKLALVSLSVTNWNGTATGTSTEENAARLINSTVAGLLAETEKKLSGVARLTRVSAFIDNPAYRSAALKNNLGAFVPKVNGTPMAIFAKDNDQLIAAGLSPEVAKKLCASLNVDGVVVIYSEWSYAQGHFVPTKRALAKDVVSVWDRNGNLVFNKRVDETGEGVLGGPYAPIVVNDGTIKQWGGAYFKALDPILAAMKEALKP